MPDLPSRRTRLRITSQSSSENLLHYRYEFLCSYILLHTRLLSSLDPVTACKGLRGPGWLASLLWPTCPACAT